MQERGHAIANVLVTKLLLIYFTSTVYLIKNTNKLFFAYDIGSVWTSNSLGSPLPSTIIGENRVTHNSKKYMQQSPQPMMPMCVGRSWCSDRNIGTNV